MKDIKCTVTSRIHTHSNEDVRKRSTLVRLISFLMTSFQTSIDESKTALEKFVAEQNIVLRT